MGEGRVCSYPKTNVLVEERFPKPRFAARQVLRGIRYVSAPPANTSRGIKLWLDQKHVSLGRTAIDSHGPSILLVVCGIETRPSLALDFNKDI